MTGVRMEHREGEGHDENLATMSKVTVTGGVIILRACGELQTNIRLAMHRRVIGRGPRRSDL